MDVFIVGFSWDQIKQCVLWMAPFYAIVSKMPLFSVYEGPKDRCRGSTGLKKENPNILVNEAHSVQTHMISLKMLVGKSIIYQFETTSYCIATAICIK